mgnify:CR=1 FL=1
MERINNVKTEMVVLFVILKSVDSLVRYPAIDPIKKIGIRAIVRIINPPFTLLSKNIIITKA